MSEKATPRPATGARRNQSALHHTRLIEAIVPRPDLAADYVVLAALLHCPNVAARHVLRLHPADWESDLHRIMARIGLCHLRTIGRVDVRQLADLLDDAGTFRSECRALELATLARVAELIDPAVVADAVARLTAHRQGAAA